MSAGAWILITYDDERLDLRLPGLNAVLSGVGQGIPSTRYQTQEGYKQHGETIYGYKVTTREITLTTRVAGQNYRDYLTSRQQLLDFLRPNRGGALTIRRAMPNGDWRDIDVWYRGGGDDSDSVDRPIIQSEIMALAFTAFEPSFYDPISQQGSLSGSVPSGLSFSAAFGATPGTGDWVFRSGYEVGTVSLPYSGTWRSYPTITLTGPYDWVRLTNEITGAIINLTVPKAAGESVILTLTPNAQTVLDGDGVDIFDELGDSNLIDFYLAPHPIAPDGANSIMFDAGNGTSATSITVDYFERYIGI